MAITFPRNMIEPIRQMSLDLRHSVWGGGGTGPVVEFADPLWEATFETPPLTKEQLVLFRGWWTSLRGGVNQIFVWDAKVPYPVTYPDGFAGLTRAGGGSFSAGTASLTGRTSSVISITNAAASFVLKAGDKVGLSESSKYMLFVIQEDVTTNGSGAADITVEPPIPTTIFTASATADFTKPKVKMRVDPTSWSNPTTPSYDPISWSARQTGY